MFKKFVLTIFILFLALFTLVACGETPDEGGNEESKNPEIELFLETEMNVGDEAELSFNIFYAESSDIKWSVDDPTLAKIQDGKITALASGTVTITATIGSVSQSATITIKAQKVSVSYELNGGSCADELIAERDATQTIVLPTPTKENNSFGGWYANAECSGEAITTLDKNNISVTKLYAKWVEKTYQVIYHFVDENDKTTIETVEAKFSEVYNVVTKEDKTDYFFSGWYKEESLVHEVKTIQAGTIETSIDLYGKMIDKDATFDIKLDFNGGSCTYQTREELVKDFLKDYNYIIGKSYTNVKQIGTSATTPLTFHTFYKGTNEDGDKMNEKWAWLAQYLYDLSVENLSSDNYNVTGLKSLLSGTFDATDNNKKGVSTSFRAFLNGMKIGSSKGETVDFSEYSNQNGFWTYLAASESYTTKLTSVNSAFPSLYKENYKFAGWYRDPECTSGPVKTCLGDATLYAYYEENIPVTEVTIDNTTEGVVKFETYQLEWTVKPSDAIIQGVTFTSSDTSIATVSETGLITALTVGKVTITMQSNSQSKASSNFEVEIYTPNYFEVSYETNSYVTVGEKIKLNAVCKSRTGDIEKITWTSLDKNIAIVQNGTVTGIKEGFVKIRATANGTADYFDFGVTVLSKNASDAVKFVAKCNEGNIFTRYNLDIGHTYVKDMYGSVSKILYNRELTIDTSYEATAAKDVDQSGVKPSTEFITVHYTGNMSKGAGAKANANYLCGNNNGVSIHYCTGNDGVYHCLADNIVAWHAGDGHSATGFYWRASGVKVEEGDPEIPVWGISSNGKFTINGRETNQDVPTGSTAETKAVKSDTFVYNGVEQKCINDMGLAYDVRDGEYYMGTTWWCYSQVKAGRICNKGGNSNSIGIESAVDEGTDIWLTWQITAQLVAKLMKDNGLGINRVVGHHFYTAKDCPQPMLENQLECWWEFIDLVKAEYELLTEYSNYEFTFKADASTKNVTTNGRVTTQLTKDAELLVYTVTIKNKTTGQTETVQLSSILESIYDK